MAKDNTCSLLRATSCGRFCSISLRFSNHCFLILYPLFSLFLRSFIVRYHREDRPDEALFVVLQLERLMFILYYINPKISSPSRYFLSSDCQRWEELVERGKSRIFHDFIERLVIVSFRLRYPSASPPNFNLSLAEE